MSMAEVNEMLDVFFSRICPDPTVFDGTPFTLEEYRRHLTFEFIKEAYHRDSPIKSMRAFREEATKDADDLRMKDKRSLAYAQHYRNLQNKDIVESTGNANPGLEPDRMETMQDKLTGHKLTPMQYFELNTLSDYPIFKAIVSKRICDVKKISNTRFKDLMAEYDRLVSSLVEQLDSKETALFATIALFTLEWKYNIELYYRCALEAEKNHCEGIEIPRRKIGALCAEVSFPIDEMRIIVHTESRYVKIRQELVPFIYDGSDWFDYENMLVNYLKEDYFFKSEFTVDDEPIVDFFLKYSTPEDWADYVMQEYDLRSVFQRKEWTNSRIRYVRKLFEMMIREMETPKL